MPGKMKVMTTKKEFINFMNNCTLADILKVKRITGAAIENRGPGVDNKSRTGKHVYICTTRMNASFFICSL